MNQHRLSREHLLFALIMLLAIIERTWAWGQIPGGLNQDEAYAAYNAWSLLNEGIDANGDMFPIYFVAWGSGMNALETYLMMPFIRLFGLQTWVIRLPQLIVGLLTIPAVYGIVRILWDRRTALCAMLLIAIVPWHIMLCRWGLESNLAPGFVTLGLYFYLRGLERPRYLIVSAFLYGLSLYCYATIWPFVPLIILLEVVYCIRHGRLRVCKELVIAAVLLCLMAFPLVLFLLINKGYMMPIYTQHFSIPLMRELRDSEISLTHMGENLRTLYRVILCQDDGLIWNTPGNGSGIYYRITIVLFLISLVYYLYRIAQSVRRRAYAPEVLIMIQFLAGLLLGMMISVNVNKVNIIHIPILIITATGISSLCSRTRLQQWRRFILPALGAVYLVSLLRFDRYYFTEYMADAGESYFVGYEEALTAADEAAAETGLDIYVHGGTMYPLLLFHGQIPASSYQEANSNGAGYSELGPYRRSYDIEITADHIYVVNSEADAALFSEEEYEITHYGTYTVAVPR